MSSWLQHPWLLFLKRHWLTVSFIFGFITDTILLNRIDNIVDNLILLAYATLATIALFVFYSGVAGRFGEKLSAKVVRFMPGVMQYSFGGLLSGMLIFYGRSGDWVTSAPFLLLILGVIVGNELVHKRSDRLVYHLSLYFVGIFSYVVLVLPVLFGAMGGLMFVLSGLVALLTITIVIQILRRIVPQFIRITMSSIVLSIGSIYVFLHILYFTRIIPPIPLSLTELAMVHSVMRTEQGDYRLVTEASDWRTLLPFQDMTLHTNNATLSCFARVYAPVKFSTEIYHIWEYKNEKGGWEERARIAYPISHSNSGGYRGYTTITTAIPGFWRCSVETIRGQVLGRETVEVVRGQASRPVTLIK
jgi:hypothetical protein